MAEITVSSTPLPDGEVRAIFICPDCGMSGSITVVPDWRVDKLITAVAEAHRKQNCEQDRPERTQQ